MQKNVFYKNNINKNHIIQIIKETLDADDRVLFAYLYGSFLEEGDLFYDIDIAIYVKNHKNPHVIAVAVGENIVERLTESGIEGFVIDNFDVRVINDASYDFVIDILDKGLLIVSKDEQLRTSYIEHISMEYRLNQIVLDEALR